MPSSEKPSLARTLAGWAILILPLLLLFLIFINPLIHTFSLSFTNWTGLGEARSVGNDNYVQLAEDPRFLAALANTFLSPLLLLRVLLLVAAPLALALLLMELRSGLRISLQAILAPLIVFSGSVLTLLFYIVFYSPREGLAVQLMNPTGGDFGGFLSDPVRSVGIMSGLLMANGLAFALPLGVVLYLAVARGARFSLPGRAVSVGDFWSRAWRVLVVGFIGAVGFSLAGLEGTVLLPLPARAGESIMTVYYDYSLRYFKIGYGAAAIQYLILPLLLLGLGLMLFLEAPRSRMSIRIAPRSRDKLFVGAPWNAGRITGIALAGAVALIVIGVLVVTVFLPWLGSVTGLSARGVGESGRALPEFVRAFMQSYGTALPAAFFCLILTTVAGFALGYLKPWGGKAVLIAIGSFLFLSPAFFLVPYYLTFRNLHIVNTGAALVLPCLLSPLGVILFTWFFRGLRDEKTALEARGMTDSVRFAERSLGWYGLFSLPVFALYLVMHLGMTLLPLAMIHDRKLFTLPLFLWITQGDYMMPGIGMQSHLNLLAPFLYLPPLLLLVIGIILVFPRLALVVRKKDEEPAPPEEAVVERMKR